MASASHQLADIKLGGPDALRTYVTQRRAAGIAWRIISRDLYNDHGLDLTYETLRRWFPDEVEAAS